MLVRKVPINFADQDSAVLVSNPGGNCHVVNAAHDAHAYEMMAAIMEPYARKLRPFQEAPIQAKPVIVNYASAVLTTTDKV